MWLYYPWSKYFGRFSPPQLSMWIKFIDMLCYICQHKNYAIGGKSNRHMPYWQGHRCGQCKYVQFEFDGHHHKWIGIFVKPCGCEKTNGNFSTEQSPIVSVRGHLPLSGMRNRWVSLIYLRIYFSELLEVSSNILLLKNVEGRRNNNESWTFLQATVSGLLRTQNQWALFLRILWI